jgi:death on curing protein
MSGPIWLEEELILLLHDDVLARPQNLFVYDGVEDIIVLAATYAVAIASNHPFIDGNKRAAFMALGLFLEDNGLRLIAEQGDATEAMLGVARGDIDIDALTVWLRPRVA